jgi:parallel beta-helix repeat protein
VSRTVPVALATYMQGNGLHMGLLTKMGPLPDGTYRYFSHLTKNYTYNDGAGSQTYVGRTGMQVSAFMSTADLGVDNAEATTLPTVDGFPLEGFTAEQVKNGELDAVPYVTYCVNYTDLSKGHFIWAGGTIGEQRIKGTALVNLEQRSLTNKLKQNIVQQDSIYCRARFGSQPLGTVGADFTEKYYCGYDYSGDWQAFTVTAVHPTDTDLIFYTTSLAQASNYFRLGMVAFDTGDNSGEEREISSNILATGEQTFTLAYGFNRPIQVGDTGRARFGCDKLESVATGCQRFFGTAWVLHSRGERWQPSADANANLMGGVGVPSGGTGENPVGTPAPIPNPPSGGTGTPGSPTARTIGADTKDACAYGASPSASASTNVTAINAAIAALAVGGGTVYFSVAGTYNVTVGNTSGLIVLNRNNTRLNFSNVSLKAAHSSATPLSSFHQDMGRVDGATQFEILLPITQTGYLATWVAGGGASTYGISEWAHGWYITNSSSAGTIKNGTIKECVGDAISIGRTASDIWVDNVIGTNCRRQGTSTGGDNIKITNCEFSYIGTTSPPANGPWAGIDVEVDSPDSATTIYIANTRCHHNKGPGLLAVVRTSNITIENVTCDYNQNYGILLSNSDTGTIKGCTLEHNKYHGVKAQTDSDGWTIGGSGTDQNRFFNNNTSIHGVITSGTTAVLSGTSSATKDHISISSDSAVTVSTNEFGPT